MDPKTKKKKLSGLFTKNRHNLNESEWRVILNFINKPGSKNLEGLTWREISELKFFRRISYGAIYNFAKGKNPSKALAKRLKINREISFYKKFKCELRDKKNIFEIYNFLKSKIQKSNF